MAHRPIRVGIVDRQPLFRRGLSDHLEATGWIHVTSDSWASTRRQTSDDVDVLLVDVDSPGEPWVDYVAKLRRQPNPPAVVMLALENRPDLLRPALEAGASGFCAKNEHETSFIEMIRRAAAGEFPIREQIDSVTDRVRTDAASVALLTGTELLVLKQWNSGAATPRIAAQLEIKEDAVQQRLRSAQRKLEVAGYAARVAD